jgi:hypothetical protein
LAVRQERSYSPDDQATTLAILDANGGNRSRTAKQAQIPRKTLSDWDDKQVIPNEIRQQKKNQLADRIDEVVWQIVAAMPNKIEKAGLKDAAIAMGTGIDKANLLRGDPTSITGTASGESAEQLFAKQYQQVNGCTEAEAQAAAEAAFAFTRIDDRTGDEAS